METNIFVFLAELEKDLADFYENLKPIAQLSQNNEIFDYMKTHSNGHSREVESFKTKYQKPEFDRQFFLNIHGQIKKSLKEEILSTDDPKTMLDKMAKSEELVGKLYRVLAAHYKKLTEYYNSLSNDIEHIAAEEDLHRDMILKEKVKYKT